MEDFLTKTFTSKDIENYISTNAEEGQYLEFKAAGALSKEPNKKIDISKDVSAFANADGGILIYGISEKDHKADKIDFVDGNTFTKEWLQQVIDTGVQRKIPGLLIDPVRFGDDVLKSVYVVKVPRSHQAPHQAADKKFYKRANFIAPPIEEYEVRDIYSRTIKTQLKIFGPKIIQTSEGTTRTKVSSIGVNVEFSVINTGQSIEKLYKMEIKIPTVIANATYQHPFFAKHLRHEINYEVYSFPNSSPLYQGEIHTLPTLELTVTSQNFQTMEVQPIKIKLYYSNGMEEKDLFLTEHLEHKDHKMSQDCFDRGR